MANRCSDCNKFVSTDIEVSDTEVDADIVQETGLVTITLSLSKNCAECGTEIATATIDLEAEVKDFDFDKLCKDAGWAFE